MPLTPEQAKIIARMPPGLSVHEQILYLGANDINLADTGWGTPTQAQQEAIGKGPYTIVLYQWDGRNVKHG